MSKWGERIGKWYSCGFWNKEMVEQAVSKGKISKEEFQEITGCEYGTGGTGGDTSASD